MPYGVALWVSRRARTQCLQENWADAWPVCRLSDQATLCSDLGVTVLWVAQSQA